MSLVPEALSPEFQQHTLAYYVWKLLRMRLVMAWSIFKHAKKMRKFWMIVSYVGLAALMGLFFWLSWKGLAFMRSPELVGAIGEQGLGNFLDTIPALVLIGAFGGVLLTSFGLLLQGLYLSGDMDFLVSAPLPMRAVFISKLLLAILPNFSLMAALGLPVLFGLGVAQGYNFLYYPLVILQMALMALTAAGISSLLVMGVVRIFPARRVAEVLAFVGAITSMLCSQIANFANMSNMDGSQEELRAEQVGALLRWTEGWNPLTWPGISLVQIGRGEWQGFLLLLATAVVGLAVFWFSLRTAESLYFTGWASMQISVHKKKIHSPERVVTNRPNLALVLGQRLFHPAVRSVMWKDALVLRRDLRNLSQIITPLIIGLAYTFLLLRDNGDAMDGTGGAPEWFMSNLPIYSSLGMALIVSWSLISRLALLGFSQEGVSYWLLKTAPISSERLVAAKFLFAYLPSLALAWLFVLLLVLLQGAGVQALLFALGVMAFWLAGLAGLNLGFGIRGARLDWTESRQMIGSGVGCVSSLVSMVFMLLGGIFFLGPPVATGLLGLPDWIGQAVGLLLGGGLSILTCVGSLWLGLRHVGRLGDVA